MKFKNAHDVSEFMKTVRECRGSVFLVGNDGSKINLKSELSLYVGIGALIDDFGENLELFASDKNDTYKLIGFFTETGQGGKEQANGNNE